MNEYKKRKRDKIFKIIGGNVDMWEIDIDYSYLSKCENEDYNTYAYNKNNSLFEYLVVKASYNIIDILEEGDYVNGYEVEFIDKENKMIICYTATFEEKEIETVVTKECFAQMSYKVGV